MSNQRTHGSSRGLRRLLCGVLSLVLLLSLLPVSALPAQAAGQSWAMPYMEQLVDWGVMRGDVGGNLAPERNITRAEFVTLINRAYGYTRMAGTPFTDVRSSDWYAQDIDIAYNMGYFKGTSPTTASPLSPVTREQAAVLLTRNLMLQETSGETLGFSDSRTLAEWSRGLIGAAAASGVINGYSDGSFRPQNNITRGEVAAMLVRSIGTPINEAGDYDMGAVYGNVTINTSGVNLRNSTITGNLYLTGGVDLGDVLLENVNVLGQIIVSGAGESNSSQSSILLRNVEADEMVVDSISNQFVTIRAEGNTAIGKTSVRTNAYVDDSSLPGFGLGLIELDGDSGTLLQLAGNPKEVINKTPNSSLQFVQGVADKVTIDEKAVGSSVLVDTGTRVGELNLDVATDVTGDGDIKELNVGAAGSTVAQLPDQIEIRPGITSDIAGTNMTSTIAAESSADPKLQAGYPGVKNVAPTSAVAVFSTNKAGTVYWALSAVADGSVNEDDLINPPVYGGKAVKSGNLKAAASKTEYTVNLSGLLSDGSYYLSAILVDDRGNRSPLKVTAFTTPDNTTPAFASGYPVISKNTTDTIQTTVMANKDCVLYYALLPSGSTAPRAQDFKAASISGHLGYGSVDLVKNVTQPVNVNNVKLDEQTKYDLYLWLTDANGAKSSSVRKITVTTPDETPPVITYLEQNLSRTSATAVGVSYTLNEPGKVYWALYADDITNTYAAEFGRDTDEKDENGNKTWRGKEVQAKAFVKAGLNALKKGTSSASRAETEIAYAISGLNSKTTNTTSYMLYVIAEDRAGNLAEEVQWLNVHTLDTDPPTVKQEFTVVDAENPTEPEPSTSIRLVFNESVQGNPMKEENFFDLYSRGDTDGLANALSAHIDLHYIDARGNDTVPTPRGPSNPNPTDYWAVDWRKAQVTRENGSMVVTLPYSSDPAQSALNLRSGATYYFMLTGIYDQALTPNVMNKGNPVKLDEFRIVFAHVSVNKNNSVSIREVDGAAVSPISIDFNFTVEPEAVESVDNDIVWDMLLWTNRNMTYELYSRPIPSNGETGWIREGSVEVSRAFGGEDGYVYNSFRKDFQCVNDELTYKQVNKMKDAVNNTSTGVKTDPGHGDREYAVHITSLGSSYGGADGMSFRVSIVAGYHTGLNRVTSGYLLSHLNAAKTENGVDTIGRPNPWEDSIPDPYPPKLDDNYPVIDAKSTSATITFKLSQAGYVNYVAVPLTVSGTGIDRTKAIKGQEKAVTSYTGEIMPTLAGVGKDWTAQVDGRVVSTTTGTIVDTVVRDQAGLITSQAGVAPKLSDVPDQGPTGDKATTDNKLITNDKRYYLSVPEPGYITSVAETEDTGNFGTMRSGRSSLIPVNRTSSVTLNNLEPDTVYLLYLVTENTSGYPEAHTECFRFTTETTSPPKLELSGVSNPTIDAYVRGSDTAYMYWYLITKASVSAPFTRTFAEIADVDNMNAADKRYYDPDMTALDAMNTRCYRTTSQGSEFAGTLFDLYVKKEYTAEFTAAILANSGQSGGDILDGSGTTPVRISSSGYPVNCGNIRGFEGGKDYVLVAMAANTATDSNYAFAVYDPVKKEDREAPKIEAAYVNYKYDASGNNVSWVGADGNTAANPTLKEATLTLAFNEGLYNWATNGGKTAAYPIDSCKSHTTNPTTVGSDVVYAIGAAGGMTGIFEIEGDSAHTYPISSINIKISNITSTGATLRLDKYKFVDAAGNGTERTLIINVTLVNKSTVNGEFNWQPQITINGVSSGASAWTLNGWSNY